MTALVDKAYGLSPSCTDADRVFGMLKDSHGGCTVRVRGHEKVFLHLMFGILVIAAQKLIGIAQSIC